MHRTFALTSEIAAYLFGLASALAQEVADSTSTGRAMMGRMNRQFFLIIAILFATILTSCSALLPNGSSSHVSVEAAFRERLALAPGVRLEASLLDVSRADAAATVIGKTVLENVGQPPYRFDIDYDPAAIAANHRYAVRVVLMKDAQLLFTTDQVYPVLTGGNPASAQVLLKRVGSGL